jgi:hypothetical protein
MPGGNSLLPRKNSLLVVLGIFLQRADIQGEFAAAFDDEWKKYRNSLLFSLIAGNSGGETGEGQTTHTTTHSA